MKLEAELHLVELTPLLGKNYGGFWEGLIILTKENNFNHVGKDWLASISNSSWDLQFCFSDKFSDWVGFGNKFCSCIGLMFHPLFLSEVLL